MLYPIELLGHGAAHLNGSPSLCHATGSIQTELQNARPAGHHRANRNYPGPSYPNKQLIYKELFTQSGWHAPCIPNGQMQLSVGDIQMPNTAFIITAALLAATAAMQAQIDDAPSSDSKAQVIQHDQRPTAPIVTASETQTILPAQPQRWVF
ncbi:hypothetical protein HKW98_05180 [Stutzerimonas urumqiensis]|uniref:hypothetical protein n=1 Tax=Stutzerimonas urumqiensis TaxID=638269 RepID=UPI003BAAFC20